MLTSASTIIFSIRLLRLVSAIFPYTTLFRSVVGLCLGNRLVQPRRPRVSRLDARVVRGELGVGCGRQLLVDAAGAEDRKSTRLNSSHRCSSYDVFCLKKKSFKIPLDTVLHIL